MTRPVPPRARGVTLTMEQRLVIIDGYNLIHRSPALKPGPERTLREAREKLVNLLSWAVGTGDAQFLVVFDGESGLRNEREGRVEVRYAHAPQSADDLIRSIVEERIDRVERLTVVTSDLAVARHARAMGADVSISDLFMASALGTRAGEPDEKPTTFSKRELEEWAELFRHRPRPPDDEDESGG
jgi:predicted RNA-binding protein with PIN domain